MSGSLRHWLWPSKPNLASWDTWPCLATAFRKDFMRSQFGPLGQLFITFFFIGLKMLCFHPSVRKTPLLLGTPLPSQIDTFGPAQVTKHPACSETYVCSLDESFVKLFWYAVCRSGLCLNLQILHFRSLPNY